MDEDGDSPEPGYGPQTSLADLASGVGTGSAAAWDELLARFERLVFAVAFREGLSVDDAADVTQATFEQFLRQLDQIRDHERISQWLITVARRQAWRLKGDRGRPIPDELLVQAADEQTVDPISDHNTLLWTLDGLSKLDRRCRELLVLLYFDPAKPSYAELADRLGRPVGSIGPTRARCLERLRDILGEGEWT